MNIIIADDHYIVRQGTAILIKEVYANANIFTAKNFEETIELLKSNTIDLLICDINMPGANGFHIIEPIKLIQSNCRILIFSSYSESIYANRFLKAGAHGYLQKDSDEHLVKKAITDIISKGRYISEDLSNKLINMQLNGINNERNPLATLSNREIEVANQLIEGKGILDISRLLNLQVTTISTYKSRLFEKLEISSVAELVRFFQNYNNLYREAN